MIDETEVAARFRAAFRDVPPAGAAARLRAEILRVDAARDTGLFRLHHPGFRVSVRVVAAVALVALMIGASGALLALHVAVTRSTPSGPARTAPRAWSSSIAEGQTRSVGMVSPSVGWRVTPLASGYVVMRTTDGGTHWSDVSPSAGLVTSKPAAFYMLDGQHIWLTQTSATSSVVRIYTVMTEDGGRSWRQGAPVAVSTIDHPVRANLSSLSLDFVDALHGWLLSEPLYFFSPIGKPQTAHLYRTADGGARWTEIAHTLLGPQLENMDGHIVTAVGSLCWWDSIAFASVSDGWLTEDGPCWGALTNLPRSQRLVTHDGGVSWAPEVITDPEACCTVAIVAAPGHVILAGSYYLYVSANAGTTWSQHALPADSSSWDFADANYGWVLGGTSNRLYGTADGGATWAVINTTLPFYGAVDLQFVDARDGFATAMYQNSPLSPVAEMWKTTDGGRTWQLVGPVAG